MAKDISRLQKHIENIEQELARLKSAISETGSESEGKSYKDMPGVEGVYDGNNMVSESGEKTEVPTNYAAKSKIVYGDTLKLVEENGEKVFKHIGKPERKKLEGVLNKKEGKWYVLTDKGSYRVLDRAVEFNNFNVNDKVMVLVPASNINAPFAAIDSKLIHSTPSAPKVTHTQARPPHRKPRKPAAQKPREFVNDIAPKVVQPQPAPQPRPQPIENQGTVSRILDDDDLR